MHSAAWVKLLRHIPAEEHNKLMLVTVSGTEIAIQSLMRIDAECLALRGRLSGSTDAGRVFFIPYEHIDYFGFQQPLRESDFHEAFGSLELSGAAPADPPPVAPSALPEPEPASPGPATPRGTPLPGGMAGSLARNPLSIKSTVLEKFRSRSTTNPGTQLRPPLDE